MNTAAPIGPGNKSNKNSQYDQEIPQSQIADKPMAPRGRATHNHHETPGR